MLVQAVHSLAKVFLMQQLDLLASVMASGTKILAAYAQEDVVWAVLAWLLAVRGWIWYLKEQVQTE